MGYEEVWKVLSDLIIELRVKKESITNEIMNDLRSAKTMIQILKVDPTNTENLLRIEMYLGNLESSLLFLAQDKLQPTHVETWMRKLELARRKDNGKGITPDLRFIPGLPRNKRWIRIKILEGQSLEDIKRLAYDNKLSCNMQENGYVLIYGDAEKLKSFIKKIRKN